MMRDYSRADLLALTPDVYLAEGWLDTAGRPRADLTGIFATATCTQFLGAELSPQELGFTFEAIRLLLPQHDEADPGDLLHATIDEALQVVARAIQQRNNQGLLQWLSACTAQIRNVAEIEAFIMHMQAVTRQYALVVALQPAEPPSSSA